MKPEYGSLYQNRMTVFERCKACTLSATPTNIHYCNVPDCPYKPHEALAPIEPDILGRY